jgi:hypothetical protein
MPERRKVTDRRSNELQRELAVADNRRQRPDRRLNGISMEWIPIEEVSILPVKRIVFSRS